MPTICCELPGAYLSIDPLIHGRASRCCFTFLPKSTWALSNGLLTRVQKRPSYSRSASATSGTASPAWHGSHHTSTSTPGSSSTPHPHPHPHPLSYSQHRADDLPASSTSSPAMASIRTLHDIHTLDTTIAEHAHVPAAIHSGSETPGGRANFVGTLQSKSAWDALVHGSWV